MAEQKPKEEGGTEGLKFRKKGEINKTTPRWRSLRGGQMEGALARAFLARATSQVLIGRWIGSHLPNGRSRRLMRG